MPSAGLSFLLSRGLTGILWALTDVPRRSADGIPTLDRYYNRAVPGSDAVTAQYEEPLSSSLPLSTGMPLSPTRRNTRRNTAVSAPMARQQVTRPSPTRKLAPSSTTSSTSTTARVQAKWVKDIPGYIAKADKNWPSVSQSSEVD